MPRFYFHLHECGTVVFDDEGCDRADLGDARETAVKAARDVMCGEVATGRLCLSCSIVITDEAGRTVGRIAFRDALAVTGL